eukprot:TRINITY_DN63864_c0_g1_i1.p1 TRINITY_DN63864_c0_g1~~TRINITY_DN63864_c0_g1_i1.p1  ORF type:complete len:199 (-),score=35.48 TRINITY_DN63864_c0_g1_i1:164-697(-)
MADGADVSLPEPPCSPIGDGDGMIAELGAAAAFGSPTFGHVGEGPLAERIRSRLSQCFEVAAQTAELLASAREGDAASTTANELAAAYSSAVAEIHRELRLAVDMTLRGNEARSSTAGGEAAVTKIRLRGREKLLKTCRSKRARIADDLRSRFPGLLPLGEIVASGADTANMSVDCN